MTESEEGEGAWSAVGLFVVAAVVPVPAGSSEAAAAMRAAITARAASVARRRAEERASASAVSLRMRVVRASM